MNFILRTLLRILLRCRIFLETVYYVKGRDLLLVKKNGILFDIFYLNMRAVLLIMICIHGLMHGVYSRLRNYMFALADGFSPAN